MTHHPAMFDMSPDGSQGINGRTGSQNQVSLKSTVSRAILVGLFGGVALIGIFENFDRFGDPTAIHADMHSIEAPLDLSPAVRQDALTVQGLRSDRLDHVIVDAAPTDLAAR